MSNTLSTEIGVPLAAVAATAAQAESLHASEAAENLFAHMRMELNVVSTLTIEIGVPLAAGAATAAQAESLHASEAAENLFARMRMEANTWAIS